MEMDKAKAGDVAAAGVMVNGAEKNSAVAKGRWTIECRDKHGNLKWVEESENLIVDVGLNELLDAALANQGATASWYIGLTADASGVVAGDTMASHGGWTELTGYDEATRKQWVPNGAAAAKTVTNSNAKAVFTITANATTVGGYFMTSSSVKGGAVGKLFSAGAFTNGSRVLASGDTLAVTASFSLSAT